ncbi:LacI family transcriptional regulator [Clostridia bacterium]|nr:LacI family transcriptional regulator [Clostridia bacterium]
MNGKVQKRVSLRDVADRAGISVTSASIILNKSGNYRNMAQKTRTLVEQVADEMGYHPNRIAKALREQSTKQIGLVIPNISNSFMPQLIGATQKSVDSYGYSVLMIDVSDMQDEQMRQHIVDVQNAGIVDGLIVHGCGEIISESVNTVPAVYLDTRSCLSSICFTEEKACYDLVELFAKQGLHKIVFVNGDIERESFALRESGFRKAVSDFDLADADCSVAYFPISLDGGKQAYQWIKSLEDKPEAVILLTDIMAYGFILSAWRDGCLIPEELAVASMDDLEMSELFVPSITCSHIDIDKMSQLAVKTLLENIKNEADQENQTIPTYVIERESSKKYGTDILKNK